MYILTDVKKLFNLPEDVIEPLERTSNQSATVAEALRLYFKHKATVKRLVEVADSLEKKLNPEVHTFTHSESLPALLKEYDGEPDHGFVDPTNRKRKYDLYLHEWVEN